MVQTCLLQFCNKRNEYKKKFHEYLKKEILSDNDHSEIIKKLGDCLMISDYTEDIANYFPHYLLVILSTIIDVDSNPSESKVDQTLLSTTHKRECIVLGNLIDLHPDVLGFALRYFENHPAPFDQIPANHQPPRKRSKSEKAQINETPPNDYEIVKATLKILKAAPNHFKNKWKWSKFYKYLTSKNKQVQWYTLKSIGIILNMSEALLVTCAKTIIPNFDRFIIDNQEDEKIRSIYINEKDNTKEVEMAVDKIDSLVSIAGILLPIFNKNNNNQDTGNNLVSVPSMELNLRCLALAVAARKCVCLQGPVGCGKTSMVEYMAKMTGRGASDIIKVQLGDQTDSKMLLGSYRCTDIPGEFVWQPGVLTQAVVSDKWLLLEDIDSAALDVASVLSNLMETRTLSVPGYRDIIYAKSGFQLFVTQRLINTASGLYRQSTGASNLLEKHWICVHMDPLTKTELIKIVETLFPVFTTIATKIVDVFMLFSMGNHTGDNDGNALIKSGRLTSTRDLIKWCERSVIGFDVSSPESALKLFQDAIDIFCCSVPDQATRFELAVSICTTLGIVKTKADYFINTYKPSVGMENNLFTAVRAKIIIKNNKTVQFNKIKKVNFSFTRPSSVLLERITSCVAQKESVLLVGETGTGKTSSIQYLSACTGHKLVVINMNQQSESADLLGGYKPIDIKLLITPVREEFEMQFRSFYDIEKNRQFLDGIASCYKNGNWKSLISAMCKASFAAVRRLSGEIQAITPSADNKKRKSIADDKNIKVDKWEKMLIKLEKFKLQIENECSLAFAFIEGSLIKAIQQGHWVLLDEINLASSETLECLSGLLEGSTGSLSLLERGDNESVKRHTDFTLFACMNPATDVGKKELPIGLRNRFTEFYVDELTEEKDLYLLVNSYLQNLNLPSKKIENIVEFYINVKKLAVTDLNDGTGHKPHYSLRTLCRALSIASKNPCGTPLRSLYEAFCLSFLTQLDHKCYPIVRQMISKNILDNNKTIKSVIGTPIPKPACTDDEDYINFEGYWIIKGKLTPKIPDNYILTSSVLRNLRDLVRVVSIGKIPVLLQGDTSVGKTSLITYLAKASGHNCVRINNHEHTDLQEYIGNYVADESGKLIFKEGVLVEAMKKGHWIILDELNLAPSDVLEALNRVLDDNRELFIPETQQTIKAHDNFMLFATQNPPGLYGGRKILSRAFRNRFVELHFDEIPSNELQVILHKRCSIPESYCKNIIAVMNELQLRRRTTSAFSGKQGFITLRDLFRWGERYRLAPDVGNRLYNWLQHLADEGYLVLAAKVRKTEECEEIKEAIKKHLKCHVDPSTLFTLNEKTSSVTKPILEAILNNPIDKFKHVVWTYNMRRMAVLVAKSCQFKEPVLLVGETGCGKTTVCQLAAEMNNHKLYSVNCHMHTESSDFLGNLRPIRNHNDDNKKKLFEWVDGPLIAAMRSGNHFLADEISLADDSVLERMNSLLEPERCLLLSEKTSDTINSNDYDNNIITAHDDFCFIGTMNPGGDYGKKELSPALRNRFTEIWCEDCVDNDDLKAIIVHNLQPRNEIDNNTIAISIIKFIDWLKLSEIGKKITVSIRDIMTWVNFINACNGTFNTKLNAGDAFFHGACLTYIDSLGSGSTGAENSDKLEQFRKLSIKYLQSEADKLSLNSMAIESVDTIDKNTFGIAPFYISRGHNNTADMTSFTFTAPTTKSNIHKVLRALQLNKALLLEGSPGVGKTSLVSAIAKASGHNLLRINLSDQTDISDLFGADLPLEGGQGGQFAWKDGPFLRALRAGHWILLDELNLASQSVLEGLNACFDHRGEIYIPELGRNFTVKPGTKLFACQNPLRQGGARRGLPKSFLNRFTQVFIDALSDNDLKIIAKSQFPELSSDLIDNIVNFNSRISSEAGIIWGHSGSPWEMNLRDIIRLCELITASINKLSIEDNLYSGMELIYMNRMRTIEDKEEICKIYQEIFGNELLVKIKQPIMFITDDYLYFDHVTLPRTNNSFRIEDNLLLMRKQLPVLKSLANCVDMKWMPILIGGAGTGKTSVVHALAQLCGQKLRSVVVNSAMDTTEILGGFEQTDYNRHLEDLINKTEELLTNLLRLNVNKNSIQQVSEVHGLLEKIKDSSSPDDNQTSTMAAATDFFLHRTEQLLKLISSMKTLDSSCDTELTEIEHKIQHLSSVVREEKCLNAGGKFEWVNSVLVKCLEDGTWLLLDQVNLCSPAVLDRLNGLLEPGGVLTIGERGIADDGNIHTITPHKNFRLFLTMDPRYGEISRAMRNRGVEIYMSNNNKNNEADDLDIKSQLNSIGLENCVHQETLIKIHEKISDKNLTADKYGINELFDTAFLIVHQILRGFSIIEAFKMACTDVYIKSKYIQDSCMKDALTSIIDETIREFEINSVENENSIVNLNSVTLRILDLQDNSTMSLINQQKSLLMLLYKKQLLSENSAITTKFINDYLNSSRFDDNLIDVEIKKILPHLILNFYEKSTINDVNIRTLCIEKSASELKENNDFITTINALEKEIKVFAEKIHDKSLPWYPLNSPINSTEKEITLSLKLALILYMKVMKIGRDKADNNKKLSLIKSSITVDDYSNAINNNKIADRIDIPVVTMFFPFAEKLNNWTLLYLQEIINHIDYKKYFNLRKSIHWVKRFYQQGELVLIDKSDESNSSCKFDNIEILLKIHYKWMKKFINQTIKFDDSDNTEIEGNVKLLRDTIASLLQEIDVTIYSVDDHFTKLTKIIKKNIVTPLPLNSESIITDYKNLTSITNEFSTLESINQRPHLAWKLKLIILHLDESLELRSNLIQAWNNLYNEDFNNFDNFYDDISSSEKIKNQYNISLDTHEQISHAFDKLLSSKSDSKFTEISAKIQLYPVYEYAFFLFVNKLHRVLCQKINTLNTENNLSKFIENTIFNKFTSIPSIPMNLLAIIKTISENYDKPTKLMRLIHDLFHGLIRLSINSNAFKNPESMIEFSELTEIDFDQYSDSTNATLMFTENKHSNTEPILLILISKLILDTFKTSKDEFNILGSASLGNYKVKIEQLRELNDLLWRNSVAFNSKDYKYTENDCQALVAYSENYIKAVEIAGGEKWERKLLLESKTNYTLSVEEKYEERYRNPLELLKQFIGELKSDEVVEFKNIKRGLSWVLLGYHQLFIFTNLEFIDPIQKKKLKIQYVEEDIEDLRNMIYSITLEAHAFGDYTTIKHDPRIIEAQQCLNELNLKKTDLTASKGFRSSTTKYQELVREIISFRETIGSWKETVQPVEVLYNMYIHVMKNPNENLEITEKIGSLELSQRSLHEFSQRIKSKFLSNYREIIAPILTALAELEHGSRIIIDELKRLAIERKNNCNLKIDAKTFVHNLVRFPTIGDGQNNLLDLVGLCTSQDSRQFIDAIVGQSTSPTESLVEQFRLLKNGLNELYNHVSLTGKLTKPLWQELNILLQQVVILWQKKELEKEKAAKEEEMLYKNKATTHAQSLTEEEEISVELAKLFPTHHDDDFSEIEVKEARLDTIVNKSDDKKDEDKDIFKNLITDDDVQEVHEIHARILKLFASAPWLKTCQEPTTRNYIDPLIQRFHTFTKIHPNIESSLTLNLSSKLYTSLNVLTSIATRACEGQVFYKEDLIKKKPYDFYKMSNIEEVKQCIVILESVMKKVTIYLNEWPDHPTLRWMIIIIRRIFSFSISSPVSRFLTGLELLLVKMREWEENAHSGVSLAEYSAVITQQIIDWRKLELNCWKDCLNTAYNRLKAKTSKWWFLIYAVVEAYINQSTINTELLNSDNNENSNEIIDGKKLIDRLEVFMSQSPLVEFQARLDLLYTFHTHAFYFEPSKERTELIAIFWNIYNYYKQFSTDVQNKINTLKTPIEKKLKDFVKIARWNDINYWSVKETVEKTHRTLHKFIREYETGLKESVGNCLIVRPSSHQTNSNSLDLTNKINTLDVRDFITSGSSIKDINFDNLGINEKSRIPQLPKLLTKAKRLCKDTILMSSYPALRVELEEFIDDYISQSIRLKNMDIDKTLSKGKQKSQAKSILQQKKMMLADYFKGMTNMGFSYRRGLLDLKNQREIIVDMTVPPVEIITGLKKLPSVDKVDQQMMNHWEGCETYYYKSLIKINALHSTLSKAKNDLGIQNMDRCSGYSNHLMKLAHEQKKILADNFTKFLDLRHKISHLQIIDSTAVYQLPSYEVIRKSADDLKNKLIISQTGLEQLEVYLHACPVDNSLEGNTQVFQLEIEDCLPIVTVMRNDAVWMSTDNLLKESKKIINQLSQEHDRFFPSTSHSVIRTSMHMSYLENSYKNLKQVHQLLADCAGKFGNEITTDHPLLETFKFIDNNINEWTENFNNLKNKNEINSTDLSTSHCDKLCMAVDQLLETILLVIQEKYKAASSDNDEDIFTGDKKVDEDVDKDDEAEATEDSEENEIREKLIESLKKDVNNLRLDDVNKKLDEILQRVQIIDDKSSISANKLLLSFLPLLKQYSMFAQFYLTEQVGSLRAVCKHLSLQLNVFLDLVTNGFCVPKDLDAEEGEVDEDGIEKNSNTGGMGLGDGEGEKDVSDQIETEDQLDDARPAGEEKEKEEDKDCAEEENGIDMSENFDSKLQDMAANEDEEDKDKDKNEDDDDIDKEMGETEEGVDKLDEELWGDDAEEDNNEATDSNEQGKGEDTGDKEMTNKDETTEEKKGDDDDDDDDDGKKEGDKEKEKPEINEIDEPAENDDQINPYHGNQDMLPEPEELDLPDDLNLDDDDEVKEGKEEENPFDIDEMKEPVLPDDKEEPEKSEEENKNENEPADDSSDDEEDATASADPPSKDLDETEEKQDEKDSAEKSGLPEDKEEEKPSENDDKNEQDKLEEEEEAAVPSMQDTSEVTNDTQQQEDQTQGSRDKVTAQPNETEKQESTMTENNYDDDGKDNGSGQAQSEELDNGHLGTAVTKKSLQSREKDNKQKEKRKNRGDTDDDHALMEKAQPDVKKQKMINNKEETSQEDTQDDPGMEQNDDAEMEMCQHIKDSEEFDGHAMDAATDEQLKKQQQVNNTEDNNSNHDEEEAMDVDMHQDEEEENKEDTTKPFENKPEVLETNDKEKDKSDSKGNKKTDDMSKMETKIDVDGEIIDTLGVARSSESAFYTNLIDAFDNSMTAGEFDKKTRKDVENMMGQWTRTPLAEEALTAWNCLSILTESQARHLSEQLRLVLEPTQTTQLKGDYRTGKRLNMRKIITYIASQFRKDKIWLRRTKPSKRDYQIVLAIDDSSSMADNHSKELAFESLSLITKAMGYLEAGELGVVSFGKEPKILHPLGEPFNEQSGSRLIQNMQFDQKETKMAQLVNFIVDMFDSNVKSGDNAKLLVILSDGRGIFSEGSKSVNQAVRRAKLANIFIVFIIIESSLGDSSILDIKSPRFDNGQVIMESYMDLFPFPFYMILKDINALPDVLSDALRQWFEIVGKNDN